MDDIDRGEYLTERLRRMNPAPYDRELQRQKKASQRRGFVLGALLAAGILSGLAVAILVFTPEVLFELMSGRQ